MVLGPVQSPIFKLKNKYRYQMLIKSKNAKSIRDFCSYLFKHTQILTYVCLHIIKHIDWGNAEQEDKISFIAFFILDKINLCYYLL